MGGFAVEEASANGVEDDAASGLGVVAGATLHALLQGVNVDEPDATGALLGELANSGVVLANEGFEFHQLSVDEEGG